MALNIVEATRLVEDEKGFTAPAIDIASIVAQELVSVGSAKAAAFDERTRVVQLHAEEATRIEFGVSPSASASSAFRMIAGQTVIVGVGQTGLTLDTAAG